MVKIKISKAEASCILEVLIDLEKENDESTTELQQLIETKN